MSKESLIKKEIIVGIKICLSPAKLAKYFDDIGEPLGRIEYILMTHGLRMPRMKMFGYFTFEPDGIEMSIQEIENAKQALYDELPWFEDCATKVGSYEQEVEDLTAWIKRDCNDKELQELKEKTKKAKQARKDSKK